MGVLAIVEIDVGLLILRILGSDRPPFYLRGPLLNPNSRKTGHPYYTVEA